MFKRKKATRNQDKLKRELHPDLAETLGQYIRRLRLMRGMKLSDLSRATAHFGTQVSQIHLSHIELDVVANPAIEELTSLAKVLDIPPQWLIEPSQMSESPITHAAQNDPQDNARQVALDSNEQKMILAMTEAILHRRELQKRQKQE